MTNPLSTKTRYIGTISFETEHQTYLGSVFHRRSLYEDGAYGNFYGIEMDEEHYKDLKYALDRCEYIEMKYDKDGVKESPIDVGGYSSPGYREGEHG